MAFALPSLSVLAVGGALLAGAVAWGFYERSEAIDAAANAATWKAASAANLLAFKAMQKQAADNAELSRANADQIRMIEEWRNARDTDIARAIEQVCPDAPMDALLRRLCLQRGGADC